MRLLLLFILMQAPAPAFAVTALGTDLSVEELREDAWIHRSAVEIGGKLVWANGLIVWTGEGWLLVDTPFNDAQTTRLIGWARQQHNRPVALAVLTHSHEDRAGGIATLHKLDVTSITVGATGDRLAAANRPRPSTTFEGHAQRRIGRVPLEIFHPGAGHAPDNIVVWFPEWRLLHGGCLIKGRGCHGIGNIADADLGAWPETLRRVRERYPAIETLLPGHDGLGGAELLALTEDLVKVALVHVFLELQIQEWKTKVSTIASRLALISPEWVAANGVTPDPKKFGFDDHAFEEYRPGTVSGNTVRVMGVNRSSDWGCVLTFELGMEDGRMVILPSGMRRKDQEPLAHDYITAWASHEEPVKGILPPAEKPPSPPNRGLPARITPGSDR